MSDKESAPVIYFVEKGLYKARLHHLMKLADKCDFVKLANDFSEGVTHVVAQDGNRQQIIQYMKKAKKIDSKLFRGELNFVTVDWFISCMKEKKLVEIKEMYMLKAGSEETFQPAKKVKLEEKRTVPMYACQRSTPFNHKNKIFTDALGVLEDHAVFRGDINAEVRALAFRRGSATLKSLPTKISNSEELRGLPYIDVGSSSKPGHCKRVIMDILSYGSSSEVDEIKQGDFYKSMKTFTGIFGIGPQTARKWFHDLKLRTLDDVKKSVTIRLNRDQEYGMEYYDDLNNPLPLAEAKKFETLVRNYAKEIEPDIEVTLVGGFRRGKPSGHDMDLLITHREAGREKILPQLLQKLESATIYTDKKAGSSDQPFTSRPGSTMDHFEKCYGIFKIDTNTRGREWIARRVDLIVVPYSQFAYALLGWTGSRHFEREIRRYAKSEKQMVLTSHGLYSNDGTSHPASSEEDIFRLLGIEYRQPSDRNC